MSKTLGALLVLTAITTALYWVNYFTSGDVAVVAARWYTIFESSFPVADGWMALTALFAGLGYLFGWPQAGRFGLLAGSALLFLAAMDITFDVENNLYPLAANSDAMKFEIVINAWSLMLGLWTIATSWRHTRA
jgi:hypothetical protein